MKIIYYAAMSLDGCIADKNGGVAWLDAFNGRGQDYGYTAFYESIDVLLLGRKTFEQILSFGAWPYPGKPGYVFSRNQLAAPSAEVVHTTSSPAQLVQELEQQNYKRAWLVGGAHVAGAFQEQGLIDDYIITVMPVILGSGLPLFSGGAAAAKSLQFSESIEFDNGIVQLCYKKAFPGKNA